jgi:hypothetical protein
MRIMRRRTSTRSIRARKVQVDINTLAVLRGSMSRRATALVLEWAALHRAELREAWERASRNQDCIPKSRPWTKLWP